MPFSRFNHCLFLLGLNSDYKRKLSQMGDKSRSFVDHALSPLSMALSKLSELVDGTLMALNETLGNRFWFNGTRRDSMVDAQSAEA